MVETHREMLGARSKPPAVASYFESIVNLAVDAFLVLDAAGMPVYVNTSFRSLWGLVKGAVEGAGLIEYLAASLTNPEALLGRVNAPAGSYNPAGERLHHVDGRIFHSVAWPLILSGEDVGQVWSFRDITDRILEAAKSQQALLEKERRFRALVENASDLITVVEADSVILYQSPSSQSVLGYAADELIGTRFFDLLHEEDVETAIGLLSAASTREDADLPIDVRLKDATGSWRYASIRVTDRRLDPEIRGLVLNSRDVTARHLLEQELQYQADHDSLTGLLNRRGFMLKLQEALTDGSSGALLLFDVDDFKDVNDSLGHQAGDRVLAELADLLRHETGESAIVSRLGGDEFSILLRETSPSRAAAVSRRLLTVLRGHTFDTGVGETLDLTTSLGLVAFPRDGGAVEELMSRVDLALYEAKGLGRNRIRGFARLRKLEAKAEARLKLRHEIRSALKEDRLVLYGQPVLDLRNDEFAYDELLLRMKQKNGRILEAKSFIDLAERSGLIVPIDFWVLGEALGLLAQRAADGDSGDLAINLSAGAFGDREVSDWILGRLAKCPDASRLIIELTETAAMTDIENAERFMRSLRGVGCRFALDDFGVGFSSLQRLRRLPVDYLKIDGSFIRATTRSLEDQALLKSIVGIARALNMQTIAESVETPEQLGLVRALGVDFAQGYHVGRPRPAGKLEPHVWPHAAAA